jgi:hypothetical protein
MASNFAIFYGQLFCINLTNNFIFKTQQIHSFICHEPLRDKGFRTMKHSVLNINRTQLMKKSSTDLHPKDHKNNHSNNLSYSLEHQDESPSDVEDQILNDILMDESMLRHGDGESNQPKAYVTHERDWYKRLIRIDTVMRQLTKTTVPLIVTTPIPNTAYERVQKSALARQLETLLWTFSAAQVQWCFPMFQFNPWVTLYMHLSARYDLGHFTGVWRGDRVTTDDLLKDNLRANLALTNSSIGADWIKTINSFAQEAQTLGRNAEFQLVVKNFKRNEHNNFEGLRELVARLFEQYSRLMVVRVDLGFKKYCPILNNSPNIKSSDFKEAKVVFKQFLRKLRAKAGIYEHVVGYAWKAEIGVLRGIHFHVVIFFDGSKVRQDVSYGEMIGKHWRDEITKGEGHYYNCNRRKHSYKECGVGMVSCHDSAKRNVLNTRVLPYLTKTTSLLKADFGKHCRTFSRSELPKRKQKKLGRQRRRSLVH